MKKKTVLILSGFLGSGKTSLLKNLILQEKKQQRVPAILMNELGSVSIDSESVDDDVPLSELLDGCICCTIQEKLESQLQHLLLNETFDTLIIETTGAAHPVEVMDAIMSPLFADRFHCKGIITVVDALRWKEREQLSPQVFHLMREQVRHASLVLLNKIDTISEMEQAVAVEQLSSLNPSARIVLTTQSAVSEALLSGLQPNISEKAERISTKQMNLSSFVHTFKAAISQSAFDDWLRALPDSVYRIKGYVPFDHSVYPTMFQYSFGMQVYFPEEMKMPLNLVVIGEGLNESELRAQLVQLEKRD